MINKNKIAMILTVMLGACGVNGVKGMDVELSVLPNSSQNLDIQEDDEFNDDKDSKMESESLEEEELVKKTLETKDSNNSNTNDSKLQKSGEQLKKEAKRKVKKDKKKGFVDSVNDAGNEFKKFGNEVGIGINKGVKYLTGQLHNANQDARNKALERLRKEKAKKREKKAEEEWKNNTTPISHDPKEEIGNNSNDYNPNVLRDDTFGKIKGEYNRPSSNSGDIFNTVMEMKKNEDMDMDKDEDENTDMDEKIAYCMNRGFEFDKAKEIAKEIAFYMDKGFEFNESERIVSKKAFQELPLTDKIEKIKEVLGFLNSKEEVFIKQHACKINMIELINIILDAREGNVSCDTMFDRYRTNSCAILKEKFNDFTDGEIDSVLYYASYNLGYSEVILGILSDRSRLDRDKMWRIISNNDTRGLPELIVRKLRELLEKGNNEEEHRTCGFSFNFCSRGSNSGDTKE